MIRTKKIKYKGFTLIEMLVAVSILILVLVGAVNVEISNIHLATLNKHRLQATNLAQMQTNLVKTIRDTNLQANEDKPFEGLAHSTASKKISPNGTGKWQLEPLSSDEIAAGGKTIEIESGGMQYYVNIIVTDITQP